VKLTQKSIIGLDLPAGKLDHVVFDEDLPGFGLRLRSSGRKVWIIQFRANGRQRRITLGDARKVDAEQARRAAKRHFGAVALGSDPQADKVKAALLAKRTLGSIADRYLEFKKPMLRTGTYKAIECYLAQHWEPLRKLPVHQIERGDVATQLGEIAKRHGPVSADRARSALSAVFAWAMGEGLASANPVIGTNRPTVPQPRDRVLSDEEIAAIWRACQDDDYCRIVRLLLLTGQRRSEIGRMRWDEIDLDRAVLTLPADRTKNKQVHTVPLAPMAIKIISAIPRHGEWLFGSTGFQNWSNAKAAFNARAAVAPWVIHDLRRTVASKLAELGINLPVIEKVLNHTSGSFGGIVGVYQRHDFAAEKRAALLTWADHLCAIVTGEAQKVVALRA
jgi:integrase